MDMEDQSDAAKSPWATSLPQQCETHPLQRLSTVVTSWLSPFIDKDKDNQPPRAIFSKSGELWPCGTKNEPLRLRYSFFRPANNAIQRNRKSKIQAVIKHIEEKIPGVKFDHVNENSEAAVRIAFDHAHPYGKNWSRVGLEVEKINSDEPTMNLSDVTGHDSGDIKEGSKEYGVIVHEFFHTLGMHHEHQHPNRNYTISATAVGKDMMDDGWSVKDIVDDIVRKLKANDIGAYSPSDNLSCMNYHIRPGWTKEGIEVKRNNNPSDGDWALLNLMYPPREQSQFEQALSKCGINLSKEDMELILYFYLEGEWGRVRSKIESVSNPKANLKTSKQRIVDWVLKR